MHACPPAQAGAAEERQRGLFAELEHEGLGFMLRFRFRLDLFAELEHGGLEFR